MSQLRVAFACLLIALCATGTAAPVPPERAKAEKELAAVATKLHGEWLGGPCEGRIAFRANGTYEWTGIGPGGDSHAGNWSVRGDSLAPTLVMKCTEASDPDDKGKTTELKAVRIDETGFTFKHLEREKPQRFERLTASFDPIPPPRKGR